MAMTADALEKLSDQPKQCAPLDAMAIERLSENLPHTHPLPQVQVVVRKEPAVVPGRMVSKTATPGSPTGLTHVLRRPGSSTPKVAAARQPRLRVHRGLRLHAEYPVYEGQNYIGRRDDQPVDIDLGDQEPADRVWSSRRHALLTLSTGMLIIEDLHSLNGTFVNRHRLYPGEKRALAPDDIVQIGTVQLRVVN